MSPVALGDVVFAKIFRRPVLVLGSLRAAQDLLEKKSGNYSDRPRLILLSELYVSLIVVMPSSLDALMDPSLRI